MVRARALTPVLLLLAAAPAAGQTVVTFENPTLAQPLTGPNTFQNGATLSPPGSFAAGGAAFNNRYSPDFGGFWSGWSYSNVADATTPGFGNQYAAYAGGGDASANYAVAFQDVVPTVTLPAGQRPQSARVTNTTYTALSMRDGDMFAKKFGGVSGTDPDFLLLTVTGRNAAGQGTGAVDFYLADYRFADNAQDYIVSAWTTIDLSALGADTASLSFGLTSSDIGQFGINTPVYVALDNLTLTPVPEPATVGLAAVGGLAVVRLRRRVIGGGGRTC